MAIITADLDGTLSADPSFYKAELRGLMQHGHTVHVLTGNPHAADELHQLGFEKGVHYSHVATVPKKHIARFKVAYMKHVGATQIIDNRKATIKAARAAGFTGHWHASPKAKES